MARRVDTYRGLAQPTRVKVLSAVIDTPGVGVAELAERIGLHENTLRDHIRVLESEGFIAAEREHRGTRGRPRVIYRPVRADEHDEAAERRIREAIRHGDLLRRIVPTETSLDVDAQHQIDALYEHLDEVGLQPELADDQLTIDLDPCPFEAIMSGDREIVCTVHARLIDDVLVRAGGPVALDSVTPFATPTTCRVHLAVAAQRQESVA